MSQKHKIEKKCSTAEEVKNAYFFLKWMETQFSSKKKLIYFLKQGAYKQFF